ncbi:MAG: galactose mutarotase [Clostridia bacterium]|nr:galactose mutarotase [Clostridia bacterium]
MSIQVSIFDKHPCGRDVTAYTLSNGSRVSARILDFGCIIANLWVKDSTGKVADVVCGYDDISGYLNGGGYQGAIVGRVANRIGNGKFTLDGVDYTLTLNDAPRPNSLHGGAVGFDKKFWDAKVISDGDEPEIEFSYLSPDMEENYPGNLSVKCTYKLTLDAGLSIRYTATTDKATIVNITNHSYFNMAGYDSCNIKDNIAWINADRILENDENILPTGNFIDITGTAYDFREPKAIGRDFNSEPSMDVNCGGYDNNFIFVDSDDKTVKLSAYLMDPKSGRKMEVWTNQPCVGFYTANMINEDDPSFKGGVEQKVNCAVCFETQKMPDAINHPNFNNTVLRPGETYDYTTIYKFV